jgi:hypothetical protein
VFLVICVGLLTSVRIKNTRRVRRENAGHDNWRCNDGKWQSLGPERGLLRISDPSISLLEHRLRMFLLRPTTTITKQRLSRGMAIVKSLAKFSAPSTLKAKGMSLGKKSNTRLYDALSNEIVSNEELAQPITPTTMTPTTATAPVTASSEGISIAVTETTTAKCDRDGGVESMDVQGQLNLSISDSSLSRIQIDLDTNDTDGTQFKTHPNVDRNLFKNQHKIGLRDSSRPFPLNQQMSILRWRLQAKPDTAVLPISGILSIPTILTSS